MFSRNYKKHGIYRDKNILIDSICKSKEYQSSAFRNQLTRLIAYCVEPEYVEAVYDAMTSRDNLDRTALDYCVSVPTLSRKVTAVKTNWDKFFSGWKLMPPGTSPSSEVGEEH